MATAAIAPVSTRLEALQNAPLNSWIALSGDETTLVATGASYIEVARKLDELGDVDAVILKTPSQWVPFSV